jgi:hypothetical protein
MKYSVREVATDAASRTPTDWAALGARILASASQATAMHMATAARLKAQDRWAACGSHEDGHEVDSAEPRL